MALIVGFGSLGYLLDIEISLVLSAGGIEKEKS